MKSYLLLKYKLSHLKEYIYIFFTIIVFTTTTYTNSFAEENIFTVNNVKVKGTIDLNFSREKYLNRAFLNSFEILMNRILLRRDLKNVDNVDLRTIKNLINSFQVMEESYRQDIYKANIKINYNEKKIKVFLGNKNLSFSRPENISALFFPSLYIDDKIQNFDENYFYINWNNSKIENEVINFILPIEDLDEISKIISMKEKVNELDIEKITSKYNEKNYVFSLMNYSNNKINIYLKTKFNNNKISKNIFYNIKDIRDEKALDIILKDLKLKITDLWKQENVVDVLMPLSIKIKFRHLNINNLEKLEIDLNRISIIDSYILEKFDVNDSFFKIYYYGNPKRLKSGLFKYGYDLKNDQGFWKIYINE